MRSWQHTATFLAFALVAAVIVFAGHHYRGGSNVDVDAKIAAADK
jgi:hypothetical protein